MLFNGKDFEVREELVSELYQKSEENITLGQVVVAVGYSDYIPGRDKTLKEVFDRADAQMYQKKKELKEKGAVTRL